MTDSQMYFLLFVLFVVVGIIIGKYLTEYYHEINKRNKYQHTQMRLLFEIAKKLGVDESKLNGILEDFKNQEKKY